MNDVGFQLRDRLRLERAALIARFQAGGPVDALLQGTRALHRWAAAPARGQRPNGATGALVAVGGYGRGELFPHSDVDVLILLERAPDACRQGDDRRLIGLLWDFGFAIGHSVRTVEECQSEAAKDVTVLTSLMEARLITGSRGLFTRFQRQIEGTIDSEAYFRAKVLEQRQRHIKYNESPYNLEPNVKESPGGLRDLHVLLWIARALGYGKTWAQLARSGLITAEEAGLIRSSERRQKEIRAWLHLVTDRREDRLVFDVQHAVAQRAGFHPTTARRASEVMMQRYYWSAKAVTQMNTIVLQNVELRLFHRDDPPAEPLDETFVVRSELLDLRAPDALDADPNAILRAFLLMAQHRELRGMSAPLMRALWHARVRIDARYRRDPRNRATFLAHLAAAEGRAARTAADESAVASWGAICRCSVASSARCSTICSTFTPLTSTSCRCCATCGDSHWPNTHTSIRCAAS